VSDQVDTIAYDVFRIARGLRWVEVDGRILEPEKAVQVYLRAVLKGDPRGEQT
jgi:hypothetical protein